MIETDQNTEPPPSAGDKEAVAPVPVYPGNPATPEGQYCRLLFLFCPGVGKQLKSFQLSIEHLLFIDITIT